MRTKNINPLDRSGGLEVLYPSGCLDVTFVWIPKCCNYNPNSGLTSGKGNRKFECRVQQPEQVLAALLRKEPAARRAFCACNPTPPLTDRGATVDRAVEDRRQDGPV